MNTIPAPDKLNISSGNIAHQWKLFRQTWENYECAIDLTSKPDEKRVATLLTVIGSDALEVFNTFEWNEEVDKKKIKPVIDNFEKYFNPKKNVTFERYQLLNRKQAEGESFNNYLIELKKLAASCEYGSIKDMIVSGVNDNRLRENLLKDNDLTLEKATRIAKAAETAREHASSMTKEQI